MVFAADSFEGLPPPTCDEDKGDAHHGFGPLAVSEHEVIRNFERYGLLDNVRLLKGFFKDSLPGPVGALAILRLDADMYGSTMDVLRALYDDHLSPGGFCIVDDYNLPPVKKAVAEFARDRFAEGKGIHQIDGTGVYWKK
jgi:O-methyltransferase